MKTKSMFSAKKVIIISLLSLIQISWARPNLPTKIQESSSHEQKLDYVIVKINGESHVVRASQEIAVIRGDSMVVQSAALNKKDSRVGVVNFVGYRHPVHGGAEDRGYKIDTAKSLDTKYSEGEAGKIYAITATSRRELHGAVFVKILNPTLRYAVININGNDVVMHDGESLDVKKTDLVKVSKVETNVSDHSSINFQIFEQQAKDGSKFEIRFSRGGYLFARIPLKIKE